MAESLASENPRVRKLSLDSIGRFSASEAEPAVIEALADRDPAVRRAAIAAAERLGRSSLGFALILALDDHVLEVRACAKAAIERLVKQPVEFEVAGSRELRAQQLETLKKWWKDYRLTTLVKDLGSQE